MFDLFFDHWVFIVIAAIGIVTLLCSVYTVSTYKAGVIERFGKFIGVAKPGLNFRMPFIDSVYEVNLATLQLTGNIETKTKDNVFVELPVTVQYCIGQSEEDIQNAYYKLSQPKAQIEAYLYNILLGHIPEMDLDDLFTSQSSVSLRATKELSDEMKQFGYLIVKVLITDIIPDDGVVTAMNRINEETRNAVANKAQGDAEYILKVRQAEADAEVKRLEGVGVANERKALAEGWEEAIEKIKGSTTLTDQGICNLLLYTNYTDMMAKIGSSDNSTLVFMPSGPEGLKDFQRTMTNALLLDQNKGIGTHKSGISDKDAE